MPCLACNDCFWVCEVHEDRPWDGDGACGCGGAGMPCPICNVCAEGVWPKELAGSTPLWDTIRGWFN